jgi:hypothetical protein
MLTGTQNQQQNNVSDWTGTKWGKAFEFLKNKSDAEIEDLLPGLFG